MEPTLVPPVVQSPGESTLHRKNATDPAGVAVPPLDIDLGRVGDAEVSGADRRRPPGRSPCVRVVDVSTTLGVVTVVDSQLLIGGAV